MKKSQIILLVLFGIAFWFQRLSGKKKKDGAIELIDALQEGVIVLDWEGRILELNQKGTEALKLSKGELEGSFLFHHPFLKKHENFFQVLRETFIGQSFSFNAYNVTLKILERRKRVLVTFLDRSENYQKEILGRDFIANASHELRTPITIIRGFAETIYDLPEISEAMLNEFMGKIVRNCERMDNLVKNLLTLADLDYLPKARLQECDLVGLIDSCIYTLLSVYPNIHAESLQNKEVILVNGDPDLLELAIMNLLENGVKYSQNSPFISVKVAEHADCVELTVTDRGIGIPEHDLDHLFDRFFTVNKARSRRLGGAGLGLSIVSSITKKHGATIDIASTVGKGTTFTIKFQSIARAP